MPRCYRRYIFHRLRRNKAWLCPEFFELTGLKVIDETFDDEIVVINFDTGSYYSLSKAAADIWGLIGTGAPRPVKSATRSLSVTQAAARTSKPASIT